MATSELTWNNNSGQLTPGPTANKVERIEQLDFNHINADSHTTILADGSTGGLDPTAASGSYTDDSIALDKHYAYRIKTFRDSSYVTGDQGDHRYVYDISEELGYPGGYPETATYNIATSPDIHLDAARQPRYNYAASGGEMAYLGVDEILRHNDTPHDILITPSSASASPNLASVTLNGKVRRMLYQPTSNVRDIGVRMQGSAGGNYYTSPDGYTIFVVCRVYNNNTISYSKILGGDVAGNVARDGVYYSANSLGIAGDTYSASFMGATTYAQATHITSYPENIILGLRLNNSNAQYNAGVIKGQIFEAGELIGTSDDLKNKSYHGSGSSFGDSRGAYHLDEGNGTMIFIGSSFHEHGFFEYLMFPEALSSGEMNQVFSYLGNKYNRTPTELQQSDLIG